MSVVKAVAAPCSSANLTTSSFYSRGDPVFRCTQNVIGAISHNGHTDSAAIIERGNKA
jgi:hypothetical protein